MAICFVIIYGYKKILDYNYLKQLGFHEDEEVYKATDEFVHGAPSDDINRRLSK